MKNTLGAKRVKLQFNTEGSDTVTDIKTRTAELINLGEKMAGTINATSEKLRLIALAQTNYEIAAMLLVKAHFTE